MSLQKGLSLLITSSSQLHSPVLRERNMKEINVLSELAKQGLDGRHEFRVPLLRRWIQRSDGKHHSHSRILTAWGRSNPAGSA